MYICAYNSRAVQWDADKAAENLRKHRIDFADAATVLSDEYALTMPDDYRSEERQVTIGMDALGRVLVVVHTWRDDGYRLISARKATKTELKQYEGKV